MAQYDAQGREIPDPRPVAVPFDFGRPLSLHDQIKRFIRSELSQRAAAYERETFEEADDFDVDEDGDPVSQYEIPEALPEWPGGVKDVDADPPPEPSRKAQDEKSDDEATPVPASAGKARRKAVREPEGGSAVEPAADGSSVGGLNRPAHSN